ncbi:MAG TPA: nucleoside recognition domain-containing protein [Paludibacteraceae bacterium]|nr:nucleoside recognition domain-containing protein [Paludibacteraceae bacterium]
MMETTLRRTRTAVISALPKAGRTTVWLLKIIIPISLAVSILQYTGVIEVIARYLSPVFSVIGLPGEAAIVFITSIMLSLYAPIAIIATLPLDPRDVIILAVMCLIAHNMIVETAVQSKTGSRYITMFLLRIISAFVAAFFLNLLLPQTVETSQIAADAEVYQSFADMLLAWLISSFWLIVKILLIVTSLMLLQNILKEFKILDVISRTLAPLMSLMGLPRNCSFLWFVAHILGLTYGSAVMIAEVESGELSREDANLLNHHIAVNHSTLEDTLLFAAIGVPLLWMIVPRFVLAIVIVWFVRLVHRLKLKPELKTNKS